MRADSLALLELLLERGQSYEDIAEVLGTEPGEVRERARAALGELGGASPDPELTDYLLGQANPVERADAVRRLSDDPDQLALASRLSARAARDRARRAAPEAARGGSAAHRRASEPTYRRRSRTGLSRRQRLVMLGLLGAAIVVLAIVLGAGGAFDGSGDSGGAQTTGPESDADAVRVKLEPQGGGDAGGQGVFGLATADQLFLDLDVHGLEQPSPDQSYVVWLLLTPDQGYPISPFDGGRPGELLRPLPDPALRDPDRGPRALPRRRALRTVPSSRPRSASSPRASTRPRPAPSFRSSTTAATACCAARSRRPAARRCSTQEARGG